ncbi:MAG: AMP-binding protein [Gammaproteobacteria bacterium]|nr:MAG: AMP-binding protein [Gammaproteobacteria bacterium]
MSATHSSDTVSTSYSLIERLFYHAATNSTHDAVVTPTLKLSYAQLTQLVHAQVQKFYDAGISSDSVIGIKCANDVQHLVLCLAATYIGSTSCTIPSHEMDDMQNAISNRCGATDVVDENIAVDPMTLDSNVRPTPMDVPTTCLLFSTSGTTGDPKLVVHHDRDLVAQAHRHIGSEQERFACLASMEHNFAKRHRLYCIAVGATNVFLDSDRDSLVAQCQFLNVNVLHVSAFQAQELLAIPNISELSNIRLKLGGSHAHVSLRQKLQNKITQNLHAGYGTTETGAIAFTDPNDLDAGESVGQPLPGIEIRTVTPDRKTLGRGEHGELAVRCAGMFREYLDKSDLTTARLEDGWFYTGDIGYLDKQQRIYLCGRADDMFVFNSMNIYPQDIESQICQYPGITDAAVLPKTSSLHGNIPVALVVFAKNMKSDLSSLKKFVKERVGIRSPRQFIIVDEIPRNASGKISRQEAMRLSKKSDHIRKYIVEALGAYATDHLKPSLVAAFVKGETDIRLKKSKMDSLARMDLLVALEVDYHTIITPQEFVQFRYLGDLVARVLSTQLQEEHKQDSCPQISNPISTAVQTNTQHYVIQFFQRIFSYCDTVAQLHKALTTLEYRLTPIEVEILHEGNRAHQLISVNAAEKFHTALKHWLQRLKGMMLDSGKQEPEPFVSYRVAPTVTHFVGPGAPADKTLLVCFSDAGGRCLMMPNVVLMQHTNSAHYDLLVIAEPLNQGYQLGVPPLGNNLTEVIEWIANLKLIRNYRRVRTLGCSAGGYTAVIAGYYLGAEMAVSVGGRFHTKSHPIKFLERIYTTWRAMRKRHCSRVLMSYAIDDTRDRHYAKIMAMLCGGSSVAVEFTNGSVGHLILQRLVERGELAPYLARTIFAEMKDEHIASQRANVIINFPAHIMRPYS